MEKQTLIIAFQTKDEHNRLDQEQMFGLVKKLTAALGGVTLRENVGGYIRKDNGQPDIEYSYTLEFFGVSAEAVQAVGQGLAVENDQEAYYVNGREFITAEN